MPICGGTLISRRYVLSAAHCGISRSSYVTIGTTNLASPRERYNIKKVTRHPFYRYTGNTVSNDLAVIELAMEVDIDMGSIPLEMNRDSGAPQVSQALSVMGFGRIAYKWNKFVPYLIHVNVPVISMDVCRKSYKEALNATSQLCAGTTGCDSCSGDSGNPIYGHGHRLYTPGLTTPPRGLIPSCTRAMAKYGALKSPSPSPPPVYSPSAQRWRSTRTKSTS